jgi:uncharacterized membrane protein YfcA
MSDILLLCAAAVIAGVVNSVAGGGTLLTFPALLYVLGGNEDMAVVANATSTIALFPGSLAAVWGYRQDLKGTRSALLPLLLPSLIGGALGTWLVVSYPAKTFQLLVPWLILVATLLFMLQPSISRWTGIGQAHTAPTLGTKIGIVAFQFAVALYGGYFGAGIGILMLSSLALMGNSDIHRMNAIKSLLASLINGTSVALFVWQQKVDWKLAVPMIVAGMVGGFAGANFARRLNKNHIRYGVITIGLAVAVTYFVKVYGS